jgi:trimethylamine--corrinoid protein Co-methyltransferase
MAKTTRRARRDARREHRSNMAAPLLSLPFSPPKSPLPPLQYCSPEQIEQLHLASMKILEETGICFMDVEALQIWESAGARVERGSQRVYIDRSLLLETIASAPEQFTLRARNPIHNLEIGHNNIVFAPPGGVVNVTDLDGGRRTGSMQDFENFLRIIQVSPVTHLAAEQVIVPAEIPPSVRHLQRVPRVFSMTDKAVNTTAHGRIISADHMGMARIVFGDPLPDEPVIIGIINASSPLRYDERMLGAMITFARAGQALIITPFILAGAMSPISVAAALAQQNAEALAGIAFTQLISAGTPVIYGGFATNVDMKTGGPAFGTPEGAWTALVAPQLARRYRLPCRGNGTLNNSKVPDAQAALETSWTIWPTVLAHTNFIKHSIGWLEGGLTVSCEKIVMDLDNLAKFSHFLNGFEISTDTLALDMIAEVGPDGHHLGTTHTLERFANEHYQPILGECLNYESWSAAGSWDAPRRANAIWKELLAAYQPPPLDPAISAALYDFAERRMRELEGENLYL